MEEDGIQIVFFGSLISILYHYRIMQKVVKLFAYIFSRTLGISSAAVLANILSAAIAGVMFF